MKLAKSPAPGAKIFDTKDGPMRTLLVPLFVLATLVVFTSEAAADLSILDISPSFPPGPYTAISVDRNNPRRIAVGTATGQVAWSENGGRDVLEAQVLSARRYDSMALRGRNVSRAFLALASSAPPRRAIRLFIRNLRSGLGIARWSWWMALGEPMTEVSDIALPPPGGRMLAASPAGIILSDKRGAAWSRTLGGPGSILRERDLMAFSVAVNPIDPSHVLAGTTAGLYVSTDSGFNFHPHRDASLEGALVLSILWDSTEPLLVLVMTPSAILQSQDGGKSFAVSFTSSDQINDVALVGAGAFVATSGGLHIVGPQGDNHLFHRTPVVGAVAWPDGSAIVGTQTEIYKIRATGERIPLLHTSEDEPFMRLLGGPGLAYALTAHNVLRIGVAEPRTVAKRGPSLAMNASDAQQATLTHLGLGKPDDTRFHNRWYAKLVPRIIVNVVGNYGRYNRVQHDGTFPIRFRHAGATVEAHTEYSVLAMWNLSEVVFGDHNVTNPQLYLETMLRENRKHILKEVRWRYREAATMVHRLRRPPADPGVALMWRMRLEEHAAYLEAVTGRQVVLGEELEVFP